MLDGHDHSGQLCGEVAVDPVALHRRTHESAAMHVEHERQAGWARRPVHPDLDHPIGQRHLLLYRRWPSKGALITACLVDAFGPLPLNEGDSREQVMETAIRFGAARITEPGIAAAFAGVFTDAIGDPDLREILSTQLQDPYRLALQEALGEPESRVLFFIDVVIGTLLHRMGMTGEPMVPGDVDALVAMILRELA